MYLNVRIPHHSPSAVQSSSLNTLQRREELNGRKVTTIVILAALVLCIFVAFVAFSFRASRRSNSNTTKNARGGFLKSLWSTGAGGSRHRYRQAQDGNSTSTEQLANRRSRSGPSSLALDASSNGTQSDNRSPNSAVNRNTSIRSVMTLPAYRPDPNENEQVLGREGERGGVDVVIEYPTEEAEEDLRDQEMEALYQIRLARRQELAEREERRRERREARERGDFVALDNIRERARAASNNSVVAVLREEHDRLKNERQRAVSSVSYADLGVARHDGTRIRANSQESERMGLLSDAASIAATSTRSGTESALNHRRGRSASSVLSIESDLPSPGLPRSRANSRPDTPRLDTRAVSSPDVVEADVGEAGIPIYSPPGYDEVSLDDERPRSAASQPGTEPPPNYSGPAQQRAEHLASNMADLAATEEQAIHGTTDQQRQSRLPRLPSLRMQDLPQIVIEPSSARPRDDR
ncbi:hypothetical protein CCHL11_06687 [Colletotrichum chlorophyti]|uniref:Uncharacterized protein n=1 Tax=Colletotrichum chlorophyti TaxID=708187 RepID=A0A1Q8RZ07_9PEZI|nr:hypothetical protein CCHL11_06687 [Colletotrichum chlorophyti]